MSSGTAWHFLPNASNSSFALNMNSNVAFSVDSNMNLSLNGSLSMPSGLSMSKLQVIRNVTGGLANMTATTVAGLSNDSNGVVLNMSGTASSNSFRFVAGSNELCRVTGNGYVGVGTQAPARTLHVSASGAACYHRIAGDAAQIQGLELYDTAQRWLMYKPASGSNLVFRAAGTTDVTQIDASGNMTTIGDITAFGSVCDARLKTQVVALEKTACQQAVQSLRPVSFKWRYDIFNESKRGMPDIGFIAQEVEGVAPFATGEFTPVNAPANTYMHVRYERLIPYIVGAMQDLHDQVQGVKAILEQQK